MTMPEPTPSGEYPLRPFRNGDSPAIVDIWRSQPAQRGLMQPLTIPNLEDLVLSKPYFDARGMIVACDAGRPIGFVHAGFGAATDEQALDRQMGAIYMLLVRPAYRDSTVGPQLLAAAEQYLRAAGAQLLYAGGIRPLNAFYLGMYGGSELPGVLASDHVSQEFYRAHAYHEIDRVIVLQRELPTFRAPIDRRQMQLRRGMAVQAVFDPPGKTWWEACTYGCFERKRFDLMNRGGGPTLGSAVFWSMGPLAQSWGIHAVGLSHLEAAPGHRRQGLATFLLSEAIRELQNEGITVVEAQTMQYNAAALGLYAKLGFHMVDTGSVLRKEGTGP